MIFHIFDANSLNDASPLSFRFDSWLPPTPPPLDIINGLFVNGDVRCIFVNGGGNVDDDNDDHVNTEGIGGKNGVVERVDDKVLAAIVENDDGDGDGDGDDDDDDEPLFLVDVTLVVDEFTEDDDTIGCVLGESQKSSTIVSSSIIVRLLSTDDDLSDGPAAANE